MVDSFATRMALRFRLSAFNSLCFLIVATLKLERNRSMGALYGLPIFPSENDWDEVGNITSQINDSTWEFIMQNQLIYCPHLSTCSNAFARGYTSQQLSCCEQCSCENTCINHASCCPSYLISKTQHSTTDAEISCELPQLANFLISSLSSKRTYVTTVKCSSRKCDQFSVTSTSFTTWVTSVKSNKTYISIECALCNNETMDNIVPWSGELKCSRTPGLLVFENLKELILKNRMCNIIFSPPPGLVTSKCTWGQITKCNMTGKWKHYDARIEYGCNAFTSLYLEIYRNVFCYMCNVATSPYMECSIKIGEDTKYPTSFVVILDFRGPVANEEKSKLETDNKCSIDGKYDPFRNHCHRITCSTNLVFEPSTFSCKQPFTSIKAMTYKYLIKLVPLIDLRTNCSHCPDDICSLIERHVLHDFIYRSDLFDGRCSIKMFYKKYGSGNNTRKCSTKDVRYFKILFEQGIPIPHDFMKKVTHILSVGDSIEEVYSDEGPIFFNVYIMSIDSIPRHKESNMWLDPEDDGYLYEFYSEHHHDGDFLVFCHDSPITLVSYTTLCPLMNLKDTDIQLDAMNSSLTLRSLNITFTSGEYQQNGKDGYLVCADKYFEEINSFTFDENPLSSDESLSDKFYMDAVEGIFSLVCTVLSVLALLITIFTFSTFSQLRTIPGKNTLALCITLLFANLLYPFAFMLNAYHEACVATGIGIHYFWLCSLFWMNVNCIHLFRVFRSVDRLIATTGSTRHFVVYSIYAVFGPIVFIVINIGVSLYTNDTVGYGGPQCYMTSQEMVLYTFALPIACIILVNIVLFLIVVFKLQNAGNVDMVNKAQRNNFKIYAKLSTLTGMTWILGFLYQWLLFKPLVFAFILFAAGQGVFIMMSFVCNSRVKSLYHGRFIQKGMSTS